MKVNSSNLNNDIKEQQKTNMIANMKSDLNFADELMNLNTAKNQTNETNETNNITETPKKEEQETGTKTNNNVDEAVNDLNEAVSKVNQSEDKSKEQTKDIEKKSDKNNEGNIMINNDLNVENKDILPQMMPNMNFGSDGQSFSSFMNNNDNSQQLSSSVQDLAEEAAILSTMAENIAIANKANYANNISEKISMNDGIKKIDTKNNIVTDIIVQYDSILINEADVEMFNSLVNGVQVNLNNVSAEAAEKSARISKTLSDLLAKSMESNKPVRIEFDNGISVIIKITRDGKLSADFLPSTQVAEAYLKENLPLLKQKFSEQNIDYESLNQRERRNQDKDQSKKKGQENE